MATTSGVTKRGNPSPVLDSTSLERAQSPIKTQKPQTADSLSSANSKTSNAGCFTKLWNAICNFFKCICPCLFGRKTQENSSQSTKTSENISSNNRQPAQTRNNKTTPEPSPLETAQTQLLTWWNERTDSNKFKNRDGDIDPLLVSKVQEAAKKSDTPQEKIVLFYTSYRWGARFFYAGISGKDEYLPVEWDLGCLLTSAMTETIVLPWTLTHPQTKKQIVVQVENYVRLESSSGSATTYERLHDWLNAADYSKSQKDLHILQALIPYAHSIKEEMGNEEYARLRNLIPAYPEQPVAIS